MEYQLVESLAVSLALTLTLEILLALLCRVRGWHNLLLVALVNLMTNPPVVLTHNLLLLDAPIAFTIILEAVVVALEGLCYKLCGKGIKRPYLFSLGANAFSYTAGLVLLHFFGG